VLNRDILRDMEHLASIIQVFDLASRPEFGKKFISQLRFPG
jgi:uncharacterized 2Fe-2S/4Fe-4S cluster protein (DUF4445 family)